MSETIFEKIMTGKTPAKIIHEDAVCVAFHDNTPQAPVHILIVPRKPLPKLSDATADDQAMLGHLLVVAGEIAARLNCAHAFRLIVNNGTGAGQTVRHLHIHLLAGRPFGWPPG